MNLFYEAKDTITAFVKDNKKILIASGASFVVGCVIGYSSVV